MRSKSRDALRNSSSTFTIGRDFKPNHPVDFVAAEVVVDLRLYPGGYDVQLSSSLCSPDSSNADLRSDKPLVLPMLEERLKSSDDSSSGDTKLPIACAVFNLPPSQLYTTGAPSSDTQPTTRHLLRFTLPTSQYEVPTIVDPLTGETRSAPPKPAWLLHLSDDKYAFFHIVIRPSPEDRNAEGKKVVSVDGNVVNVAKEVPRISTEASYDYLEKVQSLDGSSAVPPELCCPLAITDLLMPDSSNEPTGYAQANDGDANADNGSSQLDNNVTDSPSILTPVDESLSLPGGPSALKSTSSSSKLLQLNQRMGLWNWWTSSQSHIEPAERQTGVISKEEARVGRSGKESTPGQFPSSRSSSSVSSSGPRATKPVSQASPETGPVTSFATQLRSPRFSASTLIAAVLIAFLVGSLLRSLLSPADFIYVVTDVRDVPGYSAEGTGGITGSPQGGTGRLEPGWREIKRLLEVKYLVGGWDFQVAVVRRH